MLVALLCYIFIHMHLKRGPHEQSTLCVNGRWWRVTLCLQMYVSYMDQTQYLFSNVYSNHFSTLRFHSLTFSLGLTLILSLFHIPIRCVPAGARSEHTQFSTWINFKHDGRTHENKKVSIIYCTLYTSMRKLVVCACALQIISESLITKRIRGREYATKVYP